MTCKCGSKRILCVGGKCSDLSNASFGDHEHDGYVPIIHGIGGGDYIDIEVCMECGLLQNFKQMSDEEIIEALTC